jgi:hypothetical protein
MTFNHHVPFVIEIHRFVEFSLNDPWSTLLESVEVKRAEINDVIRVVIGQFAN